MPSEIARCDRKLSGGRTYGNINVVRSLQSGAFGFCVLFIAVEAKVADKLIGFQSARTMSQAMPWIADEVGLFRKYDLDFQLPYIIGARLEFKNEELQAIVDETGKPDPRAKKLRVQDLIDRRYLDGLQNSGFFDKLWAKK